MNSKKRQSGSTVVFVICAVVLSLIALGILYGVRRVAMNDQTPPMSLSNDSSLSSSDKAESDKSTADNAATTDSTNSSSSETSDAANKDQASDSSSSSNSNPAPESTDSSTSSSDQSLAAGAGTSSSSDKLPTTGPADSLLAMFGLSLMTTVGLAYIRSRSMI